MNPLDDKDTCLQHAVEQVPRLQLPRRDLWPGIEHALADTAPQHAWKQYAALAAALLLILFTSLQYGRVQPAPVVAGIDQELLATIQSEHQQNKQARLVQYDTAQPFYQAWGTQMQQLEQAEQVIYNALREEPSNLELLKMLRQIQQRQLDLIDRVFAPRASTI